MPLAASCSVSIGERSILARSRTPSRSLARAQDVGARESARDGVPAVADDPSRVADPRGSDQLERAPALDELVQVAHPVGRVPEEGMGVPRASRARGPDDAAGAVDGVGPDRVVGMSVQGAGVQYAA